MGASSLPAVAPRRRSFNLPSFRRSSASERQQGLKSVEEAARIQKAAAWQWYTRGVREAAVIMPTKPPIWTPEAPATDDYKSCIDARRPGSKEGKASINMPHEKQSELPPAKTQRTAPSRFKAEAGTTKPAASTRDTRPEVTGSSTPLYDEHELSSLRIHMADLVQQLQHQHSADNEQSSTAVGGNLHQQTKDPPAVPVAVSGDHRLAKLPSSAAPVASTIPFHIKPFSALQKLFRKVLIPKCTSNFSKTINSTPAPLDQPVDGMPQYHHHHYIHHHHHHYHFSESPEEQASIMFRRRRHSESASSLPRSPGFAEEDFAEEEDADKVEKSRIAAYLECRRSRRHSCNSLFLHQLQPEDADFTDDGGMKAEFAELPSEFSKRFVSERFLASKISNIVGESLAEEDVFEDGTFAGIRSRRRHSAQLHRKEPCLERTGGKSVGGKYLLGGTGAGGGTPTSMPMGRLRRSESFMDVRTEGGAKRTPSPGRPYWKSPSTRYYVDVQERHTKVPARATTA